MTATPEHRAVEELLGAYAVHALGEDERAEVELHLQTCPVCRQEVDAHHEIAAAMALGPVSEPPPAGLWHRIAGTLPPVPPVASHVEGASSPAQRRALRRWSRPRRVAAVAGVAAAAAAICALAVSLAATDHQLAGARQALGSSVAAYRHALTVAGHRTSVLRTSSGAAVADVVVDPGGRGYLLASRMPALAAGRTFQLWAVVGGKPISIGLFGDRAAAVGFELGSARATRLAVTVEPAGGSVTPSYPLLASGSV